MFTLVRNTQWHTIQEPNNTHSHGSKTRTDKLANHNLRNVVIELDFLS